MALFKKRGIIVTTLAAGLASFLSKKQNRAKVKNMWNNLMVNSTKKDSLYQHSFKEIAETAGSSDETKIQENHFIAEGGSQTALSYYNENHQQLN